MNELLKNNVVSVTGIIEEEFEFSHECAGENFYKNKLKIERINGEADVIPFVVSDRLIATTSKGFKGLKTCIDGQFRSYNECFDGKKRLKFCVFALDIAIVDFDCVSENRISLNGYICKAPIYRKTPLGREIADVLIAVNRPYGKSDYIPCICWGRNARYISQFPVGTEIKLEGRIQSREYLKKLDDGAYETRTAYEVSASGIEVAESEDKTNESRSDEEL